MEKPERILYFEIRVLLGFLIFPVIAVILHEYGHIAVAEYYGYETTLRYKEMSYDYPGKKYDPLLKAYDSLKFENEVVFQHSDQVSEEKKQQSKQRFDEVTALIKEKYPYPLPNGHLVLIGGPLMTLLISLLGLSILVMRKSWQKKDFVFLDWLGIFLSLFIIRDVHNYIRAIYLSLFNEARFLTGDEFKLSRYFEMNQWIIPSIMFLFSLSICLTIIIKVVPKRYRHEFVFYGGIGMALGYVLWFFGLGPALLP